MSAEPSQPMEYEPRVMQGRLSRGDDPTPRPGDLVHACPRDRWTAVCKRKPGRRSGGWQSRPGAEYTCPGCRKALGLAPLAVERAIAVLTAAGFVPDGATREEQVRIPTSRAPVYGGIGGELRTVGGRKRFTIPETDIHVTVGPTTVCIYRRTFKGGGTPWVGHEVEYLGAGNYRTKDFTRESLLAALFPRTQESGAQQAVKILRAAGVELPELVRAKTDQETPKEPNP